MRTTRSCLRQTICRNGDGARRATSAMCARSRSPPDRKSTRLNFSHANISHAVSCSKNHIRSPSLLHLHTSLCRVSRLPAAMTLSRGMPATLTTPHYQIFLAYLGSLPLFQYLLFREL